MSAAAQIFEYERDGIYFPIDVMSCEEASGFRRSFEELETYFGGFCPPAALRHLHLYFPWARQLVIHPGVLDAVEEIIGPNILVHTTTVFCKHPGDGAFVSWHQDGYYWKLQEPRLVTAWIALADSTSENGCMRVIRGSHRSGNLPHNESARSDLNLLTSGLQIAVHVDEAQATDVLLRAGQMSLHHLNIVHSSNPNRSQTTRVGFAVRYVSSDVRQETPHNPVLVARGSCKNTQFEIFDAAPMATITQAVAAQNELVQMILRTRGS